MIQIIVNVPSINSAIQDKDYFEYIRELYLELKLLAKKPLAVFMYALKASESKG